MNINITIDRRTASMIGVAFLVIGVPLVTASSCDSNSANSADQQQAASQLDIYQRNGQAVHGFKHSQLRATLQDVEDIEANGVATTSYMLNKTGTLNHQCPSLGMPVHATDQLTNPQQVLWGSNSNSGVVSQMENTGVYTGDSSGTFVLCVRPGGSTYIDYFEGDVNVTSAPSHWDQATSQIIIDGDSTFKPTITPKN